MFVIYDEYAEKVCMKMPKAFLYFSGHSGLSEGSRGFCSCSVLKGGKGETAG